MTHLDDTALLRHLCGADNPDERLHTAAMVDEDPRLDRRMAALSARLDAPERTVRWALPPPGLGQLQISPSARAMGADRSHALVIQPPDALPRLVVVLWDHGSGWETLLPVSADDELGAHELPTDASDNALLDIVLPDGPSRWAVALPRPAHGPDWTAPDPWSRFRAALYAGQVPVQVVYLPA